MADSGNLDPARLPVRSAANVEPITQDRSKGLKVIIVGGGVGGLSAAIALRQQGHHVQIYESSSFGRETGAAIWTAPNANSILEDLGISCKGIGACVANWMAEWSYTGELMKTTDLSPSWKIHKKKLRLAHRIKLHEALRNVALSEGGVGSPVQLHVSTPVQDVDPVTATVHLKNGTSVQGDVIIGADGIHSRTRARLPGTAVQPFPSGLSAFRFLIPRADALADPKTSKFAEEDGMVNGIFAPDRSIIIYPTSNNEILNFVCIHPDSASSSSEGWGSHATKSKLLEVYKGFHENVLALLNKADENSLKVWKLLDMAELPNWHHERLAVLGDAAHPFLPFLGQGGAQAIEDGVAIGVVLERGLSPEEVPERLKLYQDIRKERAELVQLYTRMSGKARGEKKSFDSAQYLGYCNGHDERDNSTQKLREWKWAKLAKTHQMTSVFGPAVNIQARRSITPQVQPTFTTATIKFNTSRTILDGLLPPGNKSFRFKSIGSIAQCTIRQTSFRGIPTLGGRSYKSLALYMHGVEYKDAGGQPVIGAFVPIVFENMADTVIAGREETGTPKTWSTIDVEKDTNSYRIHAGWEGIKWGEFDLEGLELVDSTTPALPPNPLPDASTTDQGVLLHRYSPQADAGSSANPMQVQRTVFVPHATASSTDSPAQTAGEGHAVDTSASSSSRSWRAKTANFSLDARDWDALPTMHHIIARLQEIKIINVLEAKVVEGSGIPNVI